MWEGVNGLGGCSPCRTIIAETNNPPPFQRGVAHVRLANDLETAYLRDKRLAHDCRALTAATGGGHAPSSPAGVCEAEDMHRLMGCMRLVAAQVGSVIPEAMRASPQQHAMLMVDRGRGGVVFLPHSINDYKLSFYILVIHRLRLS